MKKILSLFSAATIIAVLMMAIFFTACKKENQQLNSSNAASTEDNGTGAPLKLTSGIVHLFVEDANHQPPTGANTLLFDTRGHTPVLARDGHQITLGEYDKASAWASIKCVNKGTHVVIQMKGLIPYGVYTFWTLTFKSPGFDGTFNNLIGNGALGAPDGSQNAFVAASDGTASLSVIMPAENLSLFGSVPNCLGDVFETHIVAAYHSDFQTHGGSPGDPTTWVVQFAFPFYGSQL